MFCLKGQGKQIVIKENLSWIFLSVFVVFTLYLVVELQNVKMSVFKIVLYFNATCYISFIRLIKLFVPPICLHGKPNFNLFIYISIVLLEMLCYRHWLLIYIGGFSVTLWLNRILMINLQIFVLMLMNGCLPIRAYSFDYVCFCQKHKVSHYLSIDVSQNI